MAATAISPGLPAIEAAFAGTENAALLTRLLITMPALVIACVAPVAGSLTDCFGRWRVLVCAILLYGFAGMSGLVLDTLHGLLFGRAVLGAAVAGIMTATTALIGDLYAGPARDRFIGLQAAFTGVGGLVFMSAGGLLSEAGWRAPFAIYGLAFIVLPAVVVCLAEPRRTGQMMAAEPAAALPWLPIAVLFLAAAFNSLIFYLIPTQLPFHLYALGVTSPGVVGMTLGVFNLAIAAASLGYGYLRNRIGILGGFGLGFGLMAVGYGIIAAAASHAFVLTGLVATGAGMGCVMPGLMAGAMTLAPPSVRGRVAGGLTASIFLGQFLSPLASQPWVGWFGYSAAFRDMGLLLGLASLLAVLLAVRMRILLRGTDERLVSTQDLDRCRRK
ncbi:arabinose efflux permease family protein [Microvirga lotononidis]|uniref:Arabinose efflux permease family protein n=2 Tax=Microvirga lotononidis TaxID=864069 RepID=I4YQN0_9HYPH|nr:arabinose efflux permease family protein [Microvirga lotononidis]